MNIQIYATDADIVSERNSMNIYLKGVDIKLLMGELSTKDKLDSIDPSDIADYLNNLKEG